MLPKWKMVNAPTAEDFSILFPTLNQTLTLPLQDDWILELLEKLPSTI